MIHNPSTIVVIAMKRSNHFSWDNQDSTLVVFTNACTIIAHIGITSRIIVGGIMNHNGLYDAVDMW